MSNQKNPLVSIVFTSYNHKEYLKQALDSLINQTYSNIEIIIVDDCSTDGSQTILNAYRNETKVALHLQEKNSGSYVKASNFGASFAKGEYILFAQCDDFSETNQVEILVQAFQNNPSVGVVFSKSNLVNEKGEVFSDDFCCRERSFKKWVQHNAMIEGSKMKDFLSFSCVIPNLSAAMIKHQLFKETKGLPDTYLVVADWEFWLMLTEKTNFYYLPQALNNFRQHDTTIRSSIKVKTQITEAVNMFYNHLEISDLKNKDSHNFKIGFGAVWVSYLFVNPKKMIPLFWGSYKEIKKVEKKPLYYLFLGLVKKVKELIYKKTKL